MNNKYLYEVTKMLKQTQPKLFTTQQIEFKNCFGAVAGYVDSKIFISSGKFGIALKLPKEILDELFTEKDVKRLKYFPKGHVKREYAVFPKRILENEHQFRELLDESIEYVLSLRGRKHLLKTTMKKFTCKEIMNNEGGCDMEFAGDNPLEVAGKCGQHVMASTDEAHKPMRDKMRDQMANGTKEDKAKWFEWFQGEWDKKTEA